MGRTIRRDYHGETQRDGAYCKRCPEQNCNYCVNGKAKRAFRRWFRRAWKVDEDG